MIFSLIVFSNNICIGQSNSPLNFKNGKNADVVPIEVSNNLIFIQCSVNNSEKGWFIFDTGAGVTVMDSVFAVKNGIDISDSVYSKLWNKNVRAAKGLHFSMNKVQISNIDARIINTNGLSSVIGRKIDGIVGYDFLTKAIIEINYANYSLVFYDPNNFQYMGAGEQLPIMLNKNNWPMVEVTVNYMDKKAVENLLFDTGGLMALSLSCSSLPEKIIEFPFSMGINGAGGGFPIGRIQSIQIGKTIIKDPFAGFFIRDTSKLDNFSEAVFESGIGTAGGELLRKLIMTFDYSRNLIYIEPNKYVKDPIEFDMSGMTIITIDEKFETFMVLAVTKNSPADILGIKQGDVLVEINGEISSKYKLSEIRELFKLEAKEYKLKFKRGSELIEKVLIMKRMI